MSEYNRVYASVDLEAVKHNIISIRNSISKDAKIMSVVKADGYGHGATEIASAVSDYSDAFAVATIEEAIELRNNGIKKPILILGTLSSNYFDKAILNDISVNIYTEDMAEKLSAVCTRLDRTVPVHISVDTGMSRVGLGCNDEGIRIIKRISSYPYLKIEGIFSHFATADEADKTTALLQRNRFDLFCQKLLDEGIDIGYKHICNSAAICDLDDKCYSIVRPGIILYGLYPSDDVSRKLNLKPALELKSHVYHIKKVPANEGISYGHTYVTDTERTIATIPVGYADGYPRLLSNKGRVIINGKYAPIVGRICMDQFMVDITDIEGVNIEDTVTLIGKDGNSTISCEEIAGLCNTINYEIVCGIGKRVPRIYK